MNYRIIRNGKNDIKKPRMHSHSGFCFLVNPTGFEPVTVCLEGICLTSLDPVKLVLYNYALQMRTANSVNNYG